MNLRLALFALLALPFSVGARDACSLLTARDAEAALGEPLAPPQSQIVSPGGGAMAAVSTCRFRPAKPAIGKSISLMARISSTPNPAAADSVRASLKSMGDPKDVPGIGDKAIWLFHKTGRLTSGQLNVFSKGTIYLIFTVDGLPDESAALEKASSLARTVLSRL